MIDFDYLAHMWDLSGLQNYQKKMNFLLLYNDSLQEEMKLCIAILITETSAEHLAAPIQQQDF